MKKPKTINLSDNAFEQLGIEAVKQKTNLKNYIEEHLEALAVRLVAVRQKRKK